MGSVSGDVRSVLDSYDRSFAAFARPWWQRDAREMRRLYLELMRQRPARIAQFAVLLRAIGISDELTWRTVPDILGWVAEHAVRAYDVAPDPRPGAPPMNQYGDPLRSLDTPNERRGRFGTSEVDVRAPWDAIAIDWGIFEGEAYRARYPSMYWVLSADSPDNPLRYLPHMVGMPGQPLQSPMPFVETALIRVQSVAVEGPEWFASHSRAPWGNSGRDEIAARAKSHRELVERFAARGKVLRIFDPVPPAPVAGEGYAKLARLRVKPSEREAHYIAHRDPPVGFEAEAFIVDASSDAVLARVIDEFGRRSGSDPAVPSRRLARFLEHMGKTWPTMYDSEFVDNPYETDPWEAADGRVTQVALLDSAPWAMWLDLVASAKRFGLRVVMPGTRDEI